MLEVFNLIIHVMVISLYIGLLINYKKIGEGFKEFYILMFTSDWEDD